MMGIALGVVLTTAIILYALWVIVKKIKKIKNGQFCDCSHCGKSCGTGNCVYSGRHRNGEWI